MSNKSWLERLSPTDPSMSKRSFVTNITPLPPSITRDVAISYLHDHVEMIDLNPLVVRHQTTTAPPNATLEEQVNCKWYEITDQISYLPGGVAKSEVSYKGGFYDLDHGLQTHVFAPAGVDIKAMWKVGGNMPGEPPEPPELGVNIPKSGLYLREDVELRCNVLLMSFVKRNLKKSHSKLVEDLVSKANDPRYLKSQSKSQSTVATLDANPSPNLTSSRAERKSVSSLAPSAVSQQSSQTSRRDTPQQRSEPCSCTGRGHDVMCHNYRYSPVPAKQRYESTDRPSFQSQHEARRASGSSTGIGADTADFYSPTGVHPELSSRIAGPGTAQAARQAPKQRSQPYAYNKPLPAGPPGSTSKVRYSSPQLFGEQAELPTTTTLSERDEDFSGSESRNTSMIQESSGNPVVSELDGTGIAYWKQP